MVSGERQRQMQRRSFDYVVRKKARTTSLRMTMFWFVKGEKLLGIGGGLAEGGGDERASEEFRVAREVVGWDFGELLFDED